ISRPGTPATQNCTTVGATGTCDVVITSTATGTSIVQRPTLPTVNTVLLTLTTGEAKEVDGPNRPKKCVDAWIEINPASASNPVGTNHVLTITVHAVNGTLGNGTATASIASGPGSFVGSPSCNYTGGGASASCQVTISSTATGTTK